MLISAFALLGAAVLLGSALAVLHLRSDGTVAPASLSGSHGMLAITGFICLLIGLQGPPRGAAEGAGAFGIVAAVLLALALIAGGALLTSRIRKRRVAGLLVGVHATLAIAGFVFLAAYVFA